jgi:hypothetical protein
MRSGVARTKDAIDLLLRELQAADRVRHPFPSRERWEGRPRQEERGRPSLRGPRAIAPRLPAAPPERDRGLSALLRSRSDWTAEGDDAPDVKTGCPAQGPPDRHAAVDNTGTANPRAMFGTRGN